MSPSPLMMTMEEERLVNNHSVNSFNSETNELTVTSANGDRRFSRMCIKQSINNTMDIVITNGEHSNKPADLSPNAMGSRDIRKKYSGCAKLGLAFVLLMLFIMLIVMIIALLTGPKSTNVAGSTGYNSSVHLHSDLTLRNDTFLENSTAYMN